MRFAVVLAMVLILAPSALALSQPPIGLDGLRIVKLKPEKQSQSCSAQTRRRHGAGKVARKLRPVACEQPPRSKVLDAGFVIVFAP